MTLHWHFSARGVAVRLFLTCWLVYALHFATNTVREIYPALSLGDHFSFDVSEYLGLHDDIFALPGRGAYINNNPGASILGAIPYAAARPLIDRIVARVERARTASARPLREYDTVYADKRAFYRQTQQRGLDVKFGLAAGVMQAFVMAPLSAASVVMMFHILLSLTASVRSATLLALLYAFATPVFYRAAQLNHNLLVSHCALFAFALLWRPGDEPSHRRRSPYLVAGLLCGWAVVLDYSGVVVVLVLGLYALVRRSSLPAPARARGDVWQFTVGVAAGLALLLGYQWVEFGHPLRPAQHYMPATRFSGHGYRGISWPQMDLLWETAFGMRFGLFTSAPLLLLALYVPSCWDARTHRLRSCERWCCVLFTLALFLFAASNQYGWVQYNTGVRHVVAATPFLFLLAADVLLRVPSVVAVAVGAVTTYWSWCLAMYRDVEQGRGVIESVVHVTREGFQLPWLTTLERMGYVTRGSFEVPLLLLGAASVWVLWSVGAGRR